MLVDLEGAIREGVVSKRDVVLAVDLKLSDAKFLGINRKTLYKYRKRREEVLRLMHVGVTIP